MVVVDDTLDNLKICNNKYIYKIEVRLGSSVNTLHNSEYDWSSLNPSNNLGIQYQICINKIIEVPEHYAQQNDLDWTKTNSPFKENFLFQVFRRAFTNKKCYRLHIYPTMLTWQGVVALVKKKIQCLLDLPHQYRCGSITLLQKGLRNVMWASSWSFQGAIPSFSSFFFFFSSLLSWS